MTAAQTKAVRNRYRTGFGDMPPMRRPNYPNPSIEKQKRKLAALIERQKLMQGRKGK